MIPFLFPVIQKEELEQPDCRDELCIIRPYSVNYKSGKVEVLPDDQALIRSPHVRKRLSGNFDSINNLFLDHPCSIRYSGAVGKNSKNAFAYSRFSSTLAYLMNSLCSVIEIISRRVAPYDAMVFTGDVVGNASENFPDDPFHIYGIRGINSKAVISLKRLLSDDSVYITRASEINLFNMKSVLFCFKDHSEDEFNLHTVVNTITSEHGSISRITVINDNHEMVIYSGRDVSIPPDYSNFQEKDSYRLKLRIESVSRSPLDFTILRADSVKDILCDLYSENWETAIKKDHPSKQEIIFPDRDFHISAPGILNRFMELQATNIIKKLEGREHPEHIIPLPGRYRSFRDRYSVRNRKVDDVLKFLGTETGEDKKKIIQVTGPGGSGKSVVLWKLYQSLKEKNFSVLYIDLREYSGKTDFYNYIIKYLGDISVFEKEKYKTFFSSEGFRNTLFAKDTVLLIDSLDELPLSEYKEADSRYRSIREFINADDIKGKIILTSRNPVNDIIRLSEYCSELQIEPVTAEQAYRLISVKLGRHIKKDRAFIKNVYRRLIELKIPDIHVTINCSYAIDYVTDEAAGSGSGTISSLDLLDYILRSRLIVKLMERGVSPDKAEAEAWNTIACLSEHAWDNIFQVKHGRAEKIPGYLKKAEDAGILDENGNFLVHANFVDYLAALHWNNEIRKFPDEITPRSLDNYRVKNIIFIRSSMFEKTEKNLQGEFLTALIESFRQHEFREDNTEKKSLLSRYGEDCYHRYSEILDPGDDKNLEAVFTCLLGVLHNIDLQLKAKSYLVYIGTDKKNKIVYDYEYAFTGSKTKSLKWQHISRNGELIRQKAEKQVDIERFKTDIRQVFNNSKSPVTLIVEICQLSYYDMDLARDDFNFERDILLLRIMKNLQAVINTDYSIRNKIIKAFNFFSYSDRHVEFYVREMAGLDREILEEIIDREDYKFRNKRLLKKYGINISADRERSLPGLLISWIIKGILFLILLFVIIWIHNRLTSSGFFLRITSLAFFVIFIIFLIHIYKDKKALKRIPAGFIIFSVIPLFTLFVVLCVDYKIMTLAVSGVIFLYLLSLAGIATTLLSTEGYFYGSINRKADPAKLTRKDKLRISELHQQLVFWAGLVVSTEFFILGVMALSNWAPENIKTTKSLIPLTGMSFFLLNFITPLVLLFIYRLILYLSFVKKVNEISSSANNEVKLERFLMLLSKPYHIRFYNIIFRKIKKTDVKDKYNKCAGILENMNISGPIYCPEKIISGFLFELKQETSA